MAELLITGASGFIGGHMVRHLAADPALTVLAGTRDGRRIAGAPGRRIDVRNEAGLERALAGVDAVVHCAVGDRETTVAGTSALLQAAARAGVRRVVHLSSIAVYGQATGRVTEATPLVSAEGGGYAHWKAAAEQACKKAQTEVVILRPTIVYGPGSRLWVHQLARRILSGRWGTLGAEGEGICNLVHVADLVGAARAALFAPDAVGRAFNVNGPEQITWNAWFERLAAAIGRPGLPVLPRGRLRQRSLAALPVKALVRALPAARPWFGSWLLCAPAASELALYARAATYPTDKAQAQLGWSPTMPIAEGLALSVAWLRAEGVVP
jgi:nucleoside-diphosphate-sugar epimerase